MTNRILTQVPVDGFIIGLVSSVLDSFSESLDDDLIHQKNAEYGNAWEAEGPFLAASRMKDKITRVEAIIESNGSIIVQQRTTPFAFQDLLELMAYGKLLMAYWSWNDLGLEGNEPSSVSHVYQALREKMIGYETGNSLVEDQTEDRSPN